MHGLSTPFENVATRVTYVTGILWCLMISFLCVCIDSGAPNIRAAVHHFVLLGCGVHITFFFFFFFYNLFLSWGQKGQIYISLEKGEALSLQREQDRLKSCLLGNVTQLVRRILRKLHLQVASNECWALHANHCLPQSLHQAWLAGKRSSEMKGPRSRADHVRRRIERWQCR